MTIISTPVRSTPAIGAHRTDLTARPANVDAGAFSRTGKSESPVQTDQGIGRKIAALFRGSEPTSHSALSATATESLTAIADVYESIATDKKILHLKTFGEPAELSGLNGCMVLNSKYSADPSEPKGLLGFVNGRVAFAKSGHSNIPLTPQQQETMVAAALDALTSSVKRRS